MKKYIEDLWYGRLIPGEKSQPEDRKAEIADKLDADHIKLRAALSDGQRELLKKYDESVWAMITESDARDFICGFRIGVRLVLEALCDD